MISKIANLRTASLINFPSHFFRRSALTNHGFELIFFLTLLFFPPFLSAYGVSVIILLTIQCTSLYTRLIYRVPSFCTARHSCLFHGVVMICTVNILLFFVLCSHHLPPPGTVITWTYATYYSLLPAPLNCIASQ